MLNYVFKGLKYTNTNMYKYELIHIFITFYIYQQANYSLSSFNTAQHHENDHILHNEFYTASSYFAHLGVSRNLKALFICVLNILILKYLLIMEFAYIPILLTHIYLAKI